MVHKIISPQEWKISNWSGGTTSELYILPQNADFKKGNYTLRISIATVEIEESTFTPLKNVDRVLTVLEGEIELDHEGHHSSVLKQYEQDSFRGDWLTKSKGKVRDFNVMSINSEVSTSVLKLSDNERHFGQKNEFYFIAEGSVFFNQQKLKKDQSFVLGKDDEIQSFGNSVLICVNS